MKLFVTGAAGFIGSNLARALCENGHSVVGIDSFHGYYSRSLKESNIARLIKSRTFEFKELDSLENYSGTYIRTNEIENFYKELIDNGTAIHPNAPLNIKPWGQKEFALLDPDHNLLTFGQAVE